MKTYNGLNVPTQIKTSLIISAFANCVDWDKVREYTETMKAEMLSNSFPAIMGYPSIITEDQIGGQFMTGEEIDESHVGKLAWYVTDGHHRSLAAIEANLPYLLTELDYSTITDETDLKNYKAA